MSVWNPLNHFSLERSRFIGSVLTWLHLWFHFCNSVQERSLINTDFTFDWHLPNKLWFLTKTFIFHFPSLFYITNTFLHENQKVKESWIVNKSPVDIFLYLMLTTLNARNVSSLLCLPARRVKPPVYILDIEYWVSLFLMSGFSADYWWRWWWWWWWWWYCWDV